VADEPDQRESPKDWRRHPWRSLPSWGRWVGGVIGALFLMGIGGAITDASSEEDKLKGQIVSLERQVRGAEADAAEAEAETQKIESEVDGLTKTAEATARKIVGTAKREANSLEASISAAKRERESIESDVSAVESELGGLEERVAKGEITDGTWQLERDYLAGTYEAPGGGSCYWALLSSVEGGVESIVENGGFNKHQILTIESPYFETRGCGTWHLVE